MDALVKSLRDECSLIGIDYKIRKILAPQVDISSTQIREAMLRGENTDSLLM